MIIHIERGFGTENPWRAYTADSPEELINGYGDTPEEALEDLRRTMQSIIDRETGDAKRWTNEMKYLTEYYAEGIYVCLADHSDFNLHFENPPESTPNTLNIVVEAPEDRFQQYMAWFLPQPEDLALVTGTGDSMEEAIIDLQDTLQNYIDGNFGDETEMVMANKIVPLLQKSKFKVYKVIDYPFDLNFDNIFHDAFSY